MTFYSSIGIKQVIRYEWMTYTVELLKSGLKKDEVRKELEYYLSTRRGCGETGKRAEYTMSIAMTMLLNIWINPNNKLLPFRGDLLKMSMIKAFEPACHWAMIASAYPFWFSVAYILGSLFKTQNQIKKSQILARLYEILGERNTVERCSRYVIRSFMAWDIIRDSEKAGFYEKGKILQITDHRLMSLLIESMLYAVPEKRLSLTDILSCPAFFCMNIPVINGAQIEKNNKRVFIERFSVGDEYIGLKDDLWLFSS
jgi:hypothetical protein